MNASININKKYQMSYKAFNFLILITLILFLNIISLTLSLSLSLWERILCV